MASGKELQQALSKVSQDLDRTIQFWLDHSHDDVHGGFFTCFGRDGTRYDDLKYGWLQGRQVWTYARIYNEVERFKRQDILDAATKGADFLMKHGRDQQSDRCHFLMRRDGRPIKIQRSIFTEVFFTMGMSELARAYGKKSSGAAEKYKREDSMGFMSMMRMDSKTFHWLADLVRPHIQFKNSNLRKARLAEVKLSVTLNYLAIGGSNASLARQYRIGRSSVGKIIPLTCAAIYKVLKDEYLTTAAFDMMDRIIYWTRVDDSGLGRQKLSGMETTNALNVPMMLCCLVNQMEVCFPGMEDQKQKSYNELRDWSIKQILVHVQRNGSVVLENVSETGEMSGSAGRLMCPGHAIECGWFLIECAERNGDKELLDQAIRSFIENPFRIGWDEQEGGLFYFLDADELPPTQLEWDQKLWWPHNEAMISFLMAYKVTGELKHWENFQKVTKYAYKHFVDYEHGEWWGYLHRDGTLNLESKGGPFKGSFHVPRCLMMCEQILTFLIECQ